MSINELRINTLLNEAYQLLVSITEDRDSSEAYILPFEIPTQQMKENTTVWNRTAKTYHTTWDSYIPFMLREEITSMTASDEDYIRITPALDKLCRVPIHGIGGTGPVNIQLITKHGIKTERDEPRAQRCTDKYGRHTYIITNLSNLKGISIAFSMIQVKLNKNVRQLRINGRIGQKRLNQYLRVRPVPKI